MTALPDIRGGSEVVPVAVSWLLFSVLSGMALGLRFRDVTVPGGSHLNLDGFDSP